MSPRPIKSFASLTTISNGYQEIRIVYAKFGYWKLESHTKIRNKNQHVDSNLDAYTNFFITSIKKLVLFLIFDFFDVVPVSSLKTYIPNEE